MLVDNKFEEFKDKFKTFHNAFVKGYLSTSEMRKILKIKSPEVWKDLIRKWNILARFSNFLVYERYLKNEDDALNKLYALLFFEMKIQTDLYQSLNLKDRNDLLNRIFVNTISHLITDYIKKQYGYSNLAASLCYELAKEYDARNAEILGQNNTAESFRSLQTPSGALSEYSKKGKFLETLVNVEYKIIGCVKNKQGWNEVETEIKKVERIKNDEVERLLIKIGSKLNTWKREGYKIDNELEKYRNELNKELNLLRIIDNAKDEYYERVLQQLGVNE
jgi:hypothetical protein